MIMHELNLHYDQCQEPQQAYVLAHDEPDPTNTKQPHTLDGIYIWPVTNAKGRYEVLHLATNDTIWHQHVTQFLALMTLLKQWNYLAKQDEMQPFQMETKHGVILYDALTSGVEDAAEEDDNAKNAEEYAAVEKDADTNNTNSTKDNMTDYRSVEMKLRIQLMKHGDEKDKVKFNQKFVNQPEEFSCALSWLFSHRRNNFICWICAKHVTELHYDVEVAHVLFMILLKFSEEIDLIKHEIHVQNVITYSLKKGIQKFGQKARDAVIKEMKQMIDRKCFQVV
jgi:rubrerythrin